MDSLRDSRVSCARNHPQQRLQQGEPIFFVRLDFFGELHINNGSPFSPDPNVRLKKTYWLISENGKKDYISRIVRKLHYHIIPVKRTPIKKLTFLIFKEERNIFISLYFL